MSLQFFSVRFAWVEAFETVKNNYWEPGGTRYNIIYSVDDLPTEREVWSETRISLNIKVTASFFLI